MMDVLTGLLLQVSLALLVPVILVLLALSAWTLLQFGGILSEAVDRRRQIPAFQRFLTSLAKTAGRADLSEGVSSGYGLARKVLLRLRQDPLPAGKVLEDAQLEAERRIGRLGLGVRIGPMLGLAGTLIPLGPALLAFSSGDVAGLSTRLVVAFTTTVLGLFIGAACFVMYSVRKSWYMQDLSDLDFLVEGLEKA